MKPKNPNEMTLTHVGKWRMLSPAFTIQRNPPTAIKTLARAAQRTASRRVRIAPTAMRKHGSTSTLA